MDIFEMDHFREPEVEEVQLFLESTGTHGSVVNEGALDMDCSTSPKIQVKQNVLLNFDEASPSLN